MDIMTTYKQGITKEDVMEKTEYESLEVKIQQIEAREQQLIDSVATVVHITEALHTSIKDLRRTFNRLNVEEVK
jgi:predicted  nucleic acid-binding Zn-ribbon protein